MRDTVPCGIPCRAEHGACSFALLSLLRVMHVTLSEPAQKVFSEFFQASLLPDVLHVAFCALRGGSSSSLSHAATRERLRSTANYRVPYSTGHRYVGMLLSAKLSPSRAFGRLPPSAPPAATAGGPMPVQHAT